MFDRDPHVSFPAMTASFGLSAKQRRRALDALSRDALAELSKAFELEVEDRRVKQAHVDAIARARSLSFERLLDRLKRAELKAMCEALGLSAKGRAKRPIVARILSMGGSDSSPGAAQLPVPGIEIERAASPTAKKKPRKRVGPAPLLSSATGASGGSSKMALRRFALRAAAGYRGKSGGETFARELLACFGVKEGAEDGPVFGHTIAVVDAGKRGTRDLTVYWPRRRAVLEVVDRDLSLDLAWSDLLRASLQMDPAPQYVVLTNQRDVRLYDLAKDRGAPRLSRALDELPKYSEAFVFFEPDWVPGSTPKIINDEKVSKEVADLVAKVYRVLKARNSDQGDAVIRFTLQCIIAMFAEDIGLLPKEYFTTLLYQAAETGDAKARLAALFTAMSTKGSRDGIPYFNGGLFTAPVTLELGATPLRALTKAAEANWRYVDPHIFGSVFQGIMDDAERHASGAHYTAREDIMSVVGPTIVEPWRARISAASTLAELRAILTDLGSYRVLDPACGSGNFLYVAFRELYKLETEVLCRIYEFSSGREGPNRTSWVSCIRATNFFGIDINSFAVELAKTTLNIAKKIAFEERMETVTDLSGQGSLEVDPSLPLDNLDQNIVCGDALFVAWPRADAIVGNPPFLGAKKLRDELGSGYVDRLHNAYPDVHGRSDYCAYWFRRAHDALGPQGRAGLIGTISIRHGVTASASIEYIVAGGGELVNAVSDREWPGEAAIRVSAVSWLRGQHVGPRFLIVDGRRYRRKRIPSHLELRADTSTAAALAANDAGTSQGVDYSSTSFYLTKEAADELSEDRDAAGRIFGLTTGADVLSGKFRRHPQWAVYIDSDHLEQPASPGAFTRYLHQDIKSSVSERAQKSSYRSWLRTWWRPWRAQRQFFTSLNDSRRMLSCSQTMARPIFFFLSTKFRPTNAIQMFACDDDYSFGVMQSFFHWVWLKANGGRLEDRVRYRTKVWKTFPWPQEPTTEDVVAVAAAGRELRATRRRLMAENGWSLRELYQSADVSGPHPLKDAQAVLDRAVEAVYGKPADTEATEFLLELNQCLAEDEADGETIQGPGLPSGLDPRDPRWLSADCIEPPPLKGEGHRG